MKDIGDSICIDNFFAEEELQQFEEHIKNAEVARSIPDYGVFPNQLIAEYRNLADSDSAVSLIKHKLSKLFECEINELDLSGLFVVKLLLPWDVHSDLFLNFVKPGFKFGYNLIAPLEDVESRTILFDQCSDKSNDFNVYKEEYGKAENPVDEQFWQDNLSMCWSTDREYLSIKNVLPYQRRGQIMGFKRQFFHSSDNFHTRGIKEKSFVHIRVDFAI